MCTISIPQLEQEQALQQLLLRDLRNDGPITVYYAPRSNEKDIKDVILKKYQNNTIYLDFRTIGRDDLTLQFLHFLLNPRCIREQKLVSLSDRFLSVINGKNHGIDIQYDQLFCDTLSTYNAKGDHILIFLGNGALVEWGGSKDKERFKLIREVENDKLHFIAFTGDKGIVEKWDSLPISKISKLVRLDEDIVYFSYNWEEESNNIVNAVEKALAEKEIVTVIDKKDCNYRDHIRKFEDKIGQGRKVIVVFSRQYLYSLSCMYEMNKIIECGHIKERIYPIVTFNLSDEELNKLMVEEQEYWEKRLSEVSEQMKQLVPGTHSVLQTQEADIKNIIRNQNVVWEYLRYINSKNPTQLLENDCALLIKELKKI